MTSKQPLILIIDDLGSDLVRTQIYWDGEPTNDDTDPGTDAIGPIVSPRRVINAHLVPESLLPTRGQRSGAARSTAGPSTRQARSASSMSEPPWVIMIDIAIWPIGGFVEESMAAEHLHAGDAAVAGDERAGLRPRQLGDDVGDGASAGDPTL